MWTDEARKAAAEARALSAKAESLEAEASKAPSPSAYSKAANMHFNAYAAHSVLGNNNEAAYHQPKFNELMQKSENLEAHNPNEHLGSEHNVRSGGNLLPRLDSSSDRRQFAARAQWGE